MEPLSSALAELLRAMPPPMPRPNDSSPILTRWPALAAVPPEQLARVTCRTCRGAGLVCPTCRGARWLLDTSRPVGERDVLACPNCPTPEAGQAAIVAHIRAALAAVGAPR
jgi:hypothetical protein